ncbi:MAG: glycosyltransferase [Thioploca sp.]|nr:glycosyltransferase [Thioploca sp.]
MSPVTETLTWALVIPTYQRQAILLRCLSCAAQQTLPPQEIIVIDASPDWQATYQQIMQTLANQHSSIDWKYLPANRLSSAAQRNQGIDLATADIVFLIDDDSLMYPECAQEVIRLYAQDTQHQVAGIMPKLEALPPDSQEQSGAVNNNPISFRSKLANGIKIYQAKLRYIAKQLIKDDDIFIPYDFAFPKYTLPETLKNMATHPVPMIHGARMSYRREILTQVRFEETLERYAVNEDNDVCYRASRLGMLLHALQARICHLQTPEGRLTRFTTTALWGLNQVVLHRFHSANLQQFNQRFRQLLWQRLWTQALKDILDRRWTLPSARGIGFVLRHYQAILAMTSEQLQAEYPTFQQQLINRDSQNRRN